MSQKHPQPWSTKDGDRQHRIFDAENQPVAICRSEAVARFLAEAVDVFSGDLVEEEWEGEERD